MKYDDQRGPYLSVDFERTGDDDELCQRFITALQGTKIEYAQLLNAGLFDHTSSHPLFEYRSSFSHLPLECVMPLSAIITTDPCAAVADYLRHCKGNSLCEILPN